MRSWRFHTENGEDEQPSIAEQIPEPRKEQGGDNTNPVAPRPEVKERHIDVNVNINNKAELITILLNLMTISTVLL